MHLDDGPFRGSAALASGMLTRGQLRARFTRVFPDVYVGSRAPLTPLQRARAAACLTAPDGVLCGWSAAAQLGLRWVPAAGPAEVNRTGHVRPHPGLRVRQGRLDGCEVETREGLQVTTTARTAYDLGRRLPEVDAVIAVDVLCRRGMIGPGDIEKLALRHAGDRGLGRLRAVLELADPRAESPWETRTRLVLFRAGLPRPSSQYEVRDRAGDFVARLDFGWGRWRVGLEFDGAHHRDGAQFAHDLRRHNELITQGWTVLRITASDIATRPWRVLAQISAALVRAGWDGRDCE